MPRFTSEAAKQEWLAKCAATRAAKKGDRGGHSKLPVPVSRRTRRVRARRSPGDLDAVIERLREDLSALERAKEILEREG